MTPTVRKPNPARWAPALGALVLLTALAAGPVGAGAAEQPAASPLGSITEVRQAADRTLDTYVRPGAVPGTRAQAAEALAKAQPAPSAEEVVRNVVRPNLLTDAHATAVATARGFTHPSFVADTHGAAFQILTDAQTEVAKALRTRIPGSN